MEWVFTESNFQLYLIQNDQQTTWNHFQNQFIYQYPIMSAIVDQFTLDNSIKDCIHRVSESNKYQNKLIIFIGLVAFAATLVATANNLLYMNPVFDCQGSSEKVFEDDACSQMQFCKIHDTESVTAELHLYCDSRKTDRILIQSALGVGCAISLILTSLSDRIGKKNVLCGCLILLNLTWIFQFVGVSLNSPTILFISQTISGISAKAIYICSITLLTRFLKKDMYEFGTIIMFIFTSSVTQIALGVINAIFDDWRAVAYVYSVAILGCTIASFFVLKEDPLFLFNTGKISEVKRIVEEIGRENGAEEQIIRQNVRKIDEIFQEKMRMIEKQPGFNTEFSIKQLCRCDIVSAIFILCFALACYHMTLKGIELSLQSLQFSFNFNLILVGVANLIGFTSAIYVNQVQQKRRRGLILTTVFGCITAILFLFPFCTENGSVETVVMVIMRILICWSCNFLARLKVDTFPEKYQMLIIGIIQFFGTFGLIAAPTIVQASVDRHINAIFSINIIRLIFGALPVLCLVEGKIHLDREEILPEEVVKCKDEQAFVRAEIGQI